jgi:hypothetical protein
MFSRSRRPSRHAGRIGLALLICVVLIPQAATAGDGWRSALYPKDWTPAWTSSQGYYFADVSYAGYRHSQQQPGSATPDRQINVVSQGADASGASDSTAAVQQAIDTISGQGGGVVYFPTGLYRFDGRLNISASNVVLRGDGPTSSRLYFTRSDGMSYGGHIEFSGSDSSDLELPLASDGQSRSAVVEVGNAGNLAVGDDVVVGFVISDAFVSEHGMTGTWTAFNGTWQPWFWRKVLAIDRSSTPNKITLDVPLRYVSKVRDAASIRRTPSLLSECGVENLGLANAVSWANAWSQSQVHVLEMHAVQDCWVQNVQSFVPPTAPTSGFGSGSQLQSGGILIHEGNRVTISNSVMRNAENRGDGGNGYLFEIRQSSEVLTQDSEGLNGHHNFIQNWGFGVSGCVWLRVHSAGGLAQISSASSAGTVAYSEFHHSLAVGNLVDSSVFDDGWSIVNRQDESTGAGVTGTETVLWNTSGKGLLESRQYAMGYLIGTTGSLSTQLSTKGLAGQDTAPKDWSEGIGKGTKLKPQGLFDDMLKKRLGTAP